jgi:hypothetical protein
VIAEVAPWLEDIGKLSGILVAVGAACTFIYRALRASRAALTHEIKVELAEQIAPLQSTVDEIKSELSYNGGGSVKDMTKANGEQLAEVRLAAAEAAALAKGVALALKADHLRADAVGDEAAAGEAADASAKSG